MEKFLSPVFQGINDTEWQKMQTIQCMHQASFAKNAVIFHAGSMISDAGIVMRGSVNIEINDLWGNRSILTYLSYQAVKEGRTTFRIPFNRQQMADYLNLDRSALSKELGRMRDEGILEFRKNQFTLTGIQLSP